MSDEGDQTNSPECAWCHSRKGSKRTEIEDILDTIYSEASPAAVSSDIAIPEPIRTISFAGRYVTKVVRDNPFEVTKRFVRPQLAYNVNSEPTADSVVAKIFNVQELDNILLVITPTAKLSDKYFIHGFAIDEERHLGATTLTVGEKDLIVRTQRPDSYTIIQCSGYIALDDVSIKSTIKRNFFDMLQEKSEKPVSFRYDGNQIFLTRRRCKSQKLKRIIKISGNKVGQRCPQATRSPNLVRARPLVGNKLKTPIKTRCSPPVPSNIRNLKFNATQLKSTPQPDRSSAMPIAKTRTELAGRNTIDRSSMKTRTVLAATNGNQNAPEELRVKKHTSLRPAVGSSNLKQLMRHENMNNNNNNIRPTTSPLKENSTYSVLCSRCKAPTTSNSQSTFVKIPAKMSAKPRVAFGSRVLNPTPRSPEIKKRIYSILKNQCSLPVRKDSRHSVHELEPGKSAHVAVGSSDSSSRPPVRKSSVSSVKGLQIRRGIQSILGSRYSSPVKKECGHKSELRKSPRFAFGNSDFNTGNSFNSPEKSESCSCAIKDQTRSIPQNRSSSPISKNAHSSVNRSMVKKSSAHENVRKKLSTNSRTSIGSNDLKMTMMRSRSSSPMSKGSRISNRSMTSNRTMRNRSSSPVSNGSCNTVVGNGNSSESEDPKTLIAARSNAPFLADSNASISRRVRKTAAMNRTNSDDSVFKTPMGTRSNSPVPSINNKDTFHRTHNRDIKNRTRMGADYKSESLVSINSIQIQSKTRTPMPFNTYSENSVNEDWVLSEQSSCEQVGDGMARTSIPDEESSISIATATSYTSFVGAPVKNAKHAEPDNFSSVMTMSNFPLKSDLNKKQEDDKAKFVKNRKLIANKRERAKLLLRERMWNCYPCFNSKRQVNFSLFHAEERQAQREEARRRALEAVKEPSDGIKVLWAPHQMCESVGAIHLPTKVSKIQFEDSQTVIKANSSFFEQLMEPVRVPINFSKRANDKLRSKLNRMNAKQAFENLGKLVEMINARPIPQNRQLLTFFRIAELLDIKLYTRMENHWPNSAPTLDPRCRVDCYMFDDCKDFVLSIGMLTEQLHQFTEMFPGIKPNIRQIDNALELTLMPTVLTKCIRKILVSLHARGLFDRLADMVYEIMHPMPGTLALPNPKPKSNQRPNEWEQKRKQNQLNKVLEMEKTVRKLKLQQSRYK